MALRVALVAVLLPAIWADVPVSETSAVTSGMSPIRKVITLVEEMKATVEKEGDEDLIAYDKYMCWCETNEAEKTQAIKDAEEHIADLTAFLAEGKAKSGELKTEIETLEQDIEEDQNAIAEATGVRTKENEAFLAEEADMKETRGLLGEAIEVLSKVQLTQKGAMPKEATAALIQVRNVIQRRSPKFSSIMQKDLFDVLGSLQGNLRGASLEQNDALPWEKSEEQVGREANPNDLEGASAGSKSYNSRSGQILGLLAEMRDEFSRDLGAAQRADLEAEVQFQKLRAAKMSEISAASEQKDSKEQQLADLENKMASAEKDIDRTEKAKTEDEKFLANLKKNCKTEDEQFKERTKVRSEEIRALAETLTILTADDARDLFGKTVSFLQVDASAAERVALEDRVTERAMQRLAKVAKKTHNWALVSLAARVRLDAFVKVKEAMDKMLAELQTQQKEEYEKWETCKKDIDKTEDSIKVGENTKEDLDGKHKELQNTIDTTDAQIAELKQQITDMEISLKQAGEQRHEENQAYQTAVSDQRATVNILNKALARLKEFYEKSFFVQVHAHNGQAPPPEPKDYSKSGGAGGVLQLLAKCIQDAQVAEQDLVMGEQKAQEIYASFAQDTADSIEANRASIEEKQVAFASAKTEISEVEEAQLANDAELSKLKDLLHAHHIDCDFTLKYFDIRQKARAEEMDAINDAKAILSGADYGK